MLKKIMKAALAASLVFGMTSFAYADFKVGGVMREYFGQYSSGVDKESAYFVNRGEANLQVNVDNGKIGAFYEMEDRAGSQNFAIQRRVFYNAGAATINVGTVETVGSVPHNAVNGWMTSTPAHALSMSLKLNHKEDDGMRIDIPLEGMGVIQFAYFSSAGTIAMGVPAVAGGLGMSTTGTAMELGADLNFGGIGVRAGYSSHTIDDPTTDGDGDEGAVTMNLSALIPVGGMKIMVNYSTLKVTQYVDITVDKTTDDGDIGVTGVAVELPAGPGKLTAAYEMTTFKDYKAENVMNVNYNMPLAKVGGLIAGYSSKAHAYDKAAFGKDITATEILFGFYAVY